MDARLIIKYQGKINKLLVEPDVDKKEPYKELASK